MRLKAVKTAPAGGRRDESALIPAAPAPARGLKK
jgi:hypothetical protein